jgi:Zn-dependent protease with chaperone function
MSTYLIRDDFKEIRRVVHEHLEGEGFELVGAFVGQAGKRYSSRWVTFAWNGIETRIVIEEHADTALVSAKFFCSLPHRVLLLIPLTSFVTIIVFLALNLDRFLWALGSCIVTIEAAIIVHPVSLGSNVLLSELSGYYVLLSVTCIALFFLYKLASRLETQAARVLAHVRTEFWSSLKTKFRLRQIAISNPHGLSSGWVIAYVSTLLIAMGIFLFRIHYLLLLYAFPFLLCVCLHSLISQLYEHQPALYPKILSVIACNKLTFLNFLLLLLVAFGIALAGLRHSVREIKISESLTPLVRFRQCFTKEGLSLDEVYTGAERVEQLKKETEPLIEMLTEKVRRAQNYGPYIQGVIVASTAFLIAIPLWLFFSIGFNSIVRSVFMTATSWRDYAAQKEIDWIRLPAFVESTGVRDMRFRLSIVLLFICGSFLNVAALVVATDVIWLVFKDQTLFLPQIQVALSWFFVPFLAADMFLGSQHTWFWDSLARLVIMVTALPPLIIFGRRVVGICYNSFARAASVVMRLFAARPIPEKPRRYIRAVCAQHGIVRPRVRRIASGDIRLSVKASPFCRMPLLLISDGALSQFKESELNAAIAHELAHINQGMNTHYFLRVLSILGGYPPWFLLLLVDFRHLEQEADVFALRAGADPQALAHAIIKTSCAGTLTGLQNSPRMVRLVKHLTSRLPKSFLRPLQSVMILDRFLCSNDLVGYSHHLPRDRIAAVLMKPDR